MKLEMLEKQLLRFLGHGIDKGEVRLGFDGESTILGLDEAIEEIKVWVGAGKYVADGEISVRPMLPEGCEKYA
jgi:hypothetical protein